MLEVQLVKGYRLNMNLKDTPIYITIFYISSLVLSLLNSLAYFSALGIINFLGILSATDLLIPNLTSIFYTIFYFVLMFFFFSGESSRKVQVLSKHLGKIYFLLAVLIGIVVGDELVVFSIMLVFCAWYMFYTSKHFLEINKLARKVFNFVPLIVFLTLLNGNNEAKLSVMFYFTPVEIHSQSEAIKRGKKYHLMKTLSAGYIVRELDKNQIIYIDKTSVQALKFRRIDTSNLKRIKVLSPDHRNTPLK